MPGERLEVVRFAKKGGEIGGQRVDKGFPLSLVALLQQFQIIGKVGQFAGA